MCSRFPIGQYLQERWGAPAALLVADGTRRAVISHMTTQTLFRWHTVAVHRAPTLIRYLPFFRLQVTATGCTSSQPRFPVSAGRLPSNGFSGRPLGRWWVGLQTMGLQLGAGLPRRRLIASAHALFSDGAAPCFGPRFPALGFVVLVGAGNGRESAERAPSAVTAAKSSAEIGKSTSVPPRASHSIHWLRQVLGACWEKPQCYWLLTIVIHDDELWCFI